MASNVVIGGKNKMAIGVMFDTVTIELKFESDYEAQVVFDDLADRLAAGQPVTLSPQN